jgi:hypothetical protein
MHGMVGGGGVSWISNVADLNPDPCFLGLLDPDPLVRGMDPDSDPAPDPDPSTYHQAKIVRKP